jgi:uncharacterized membrane protein
MTAFGGEAAVRLCRLTGVADEGAATLSTFAPGLSFQGLVTCGVIIAGLGVLNDVTITQSSAVWELRAAAPDASRRRVFAGAMRIGRDHIASTIYTIVFAYAGTALTVLLLVQLYDRPALDLLSSEDISEEVVRTLVSATSLVLAVPLTTAIATLVAAPGGRRLAPEARLDHPEPQPAPVFVEAAEWLAEERPADEDFDDFWGERGRRSRRPR